MGGLDPAALRSQFPALARQLGGRPVAFLDAPGGTQVPQRVVDAYGTYLREHNANTHGAFATSQESDRIVAEAHAAMEDLLAAPPGSVKFGPNMTTLTFLLSRAVGQLLRPGDDVIVTRLDHDANVTPWVLAAHDAGASVRWVDIDPADCTLDLDSFEAALDRRPRLVALGMASNATGTLSPLAALVERAHRAGAWVAVDAVHAAPHVPIDAVVLGADFLACSVYKFFGPHQAVMYVRPDRQGELPEYRLRPAPDALEPGTQNHEAMAATVAALEYLAEIGRAADAEARAAFPGLRDRALDLHVAMAEIAAYERTISERLLDGLATIPGLTVYGISDATRLSERTPTVALRLAGWPPQDLAAELGRRGIFTWDGDFYAVHLIERLGLAESGGLLRAGFVHYHTFDEVDRLVVELDALASSRG